MALARRETINALRAQLLASQLCKTTNMPGTVRSTVDRLDKPSAYYHNRVCYTIPFGAMQDSARLTGDFSLEQEAQVRQRQ